MSDAEPISEEVLAARKRWFESYVDVLENHSTRLEPGEESDRCPCCGYKTLCGRGGFEICDVCYWEDDGQDDADADRVRGGPNGTLSLTQARANYKAFGASSERRSKFVRPPLTEEM